MTAPFRWPSFLVDCLPWFAASSGASWDAAGHAWVFAIGGATDLWPMGEMLPAWLTVSVIFYDRRPWRRGLKRLSIRVRSDVRLISERRARAAGWEPLWPR